MEPKEPCIITLPVGPSSSDHTPALQELKELCEQGHEPGTPVIVQEPNGDLVVIIAVHPPAPQPT